MDNNVSEQEQSAVTKGGTAQGGAAQEVSQHSPQPAAQGAAQPQTRAKPKSKAHGAGLTPVLRELAALVIKVVGVVAVIVCLFTFVYGVHRNLDPQMNPAMKDGDLIIFYRLDKRYLFGETLLLDFQGKRQVRRVVAIAGDTVDFSERGDLVINGYPQQEASIYEATFRYENDLVFPLTVPEGQVFVLADARQNGTDSRVYGTVKVEDTLGKVIGIFRRRNI